MSEFDQTILIDKPAGMTSFGVVARLRRVLTQQAGRKVKVGHTGTLDPFATGLMIVVTGKMCRQAEQFSKLDKTYLATIRLGQASTTDDPEGEISPVEAKVPTAEQIEASLAQFKGQIWQRPPIYSAIKIDGQRAYKRARSGEVIEMPLRQINVYDLELVSYNYPDLIIKTHVSSGTYIRTLARDIGASLDSAAYCQQLRRLSVGEYEIAAARQLSDFGIDS